MAFVNYLLLITYLKFKFHDELRQTNIILKQMLVCSTVYSLRPSGGIACFFFSQYLGNFFIFSIMSILFRQSSIMLSSTCTEKERKKEGFIFNK